MQTYPTTSLPLLSSDTFDGMTRTERLDYLKRATELERRFNRTRLSHYRPYPKQAEFHAAGATHRERLFMAGNRVGQTQCGAAEMAFHLTGLYPDWWAGKRFAKAVRAWAAGVTNESTRDVVQEKLIGPPDRQEEWGTGLIPGDLMLKPSLARGVADSVDTVSVKHASGTKSMLQFKSYERGREATGIFPMPA
jgi:phage terminase large subunit-like protein